MAEKTTKTNEPTEKKKKSIPFAESIFFKRFVATTADLLVIIAISLVSFILVSYTLGGFDMGIFKVSVFISGLIWLAGGVFILLKDGPIPLSNFDNRTPGKYFLHIRVTDLEYKPLTYKMSIVRNFIVAAGVMIAAIGQLFSAISLPFISTITSIVVLVLGLVWVFFAIKEVWAMYTAEDHRRPGDIKAGTIVEYY